MVGGSLTLVFASENVAEGLVGSSWALLVRPIPLTRSLKATVFDRPSVRAAKPMALLMPANGPLKGLATSNDLPSEPALPA